MKLLKDFEGRTIRLTLERLEHIREHPEMRGLSGRIKETLAHPLKVVQSLSDSEVRLYYRFYFATVVGNKYLCVVVKVREDDAFVLTAYLTDTLKKGAVLWPKRL